MKRFIAAILFLSGFAAAFITGCVHEPQLPIVEPDGNYPKEVAKIIVTKCTYSGCHNQASYHNAADILLDTWEHMFEGGVSGAQVVAYSPMYSPLLYYCNTDSSLGVVAKNLGHLDTPLTRAEYLVLRDWVAAGAPDKHGNIPFVGNVDTRQKIYITNQGCDLLAVVDAKSRVVMRYIEVGMSTSKAESPHDVAMAGDGMNAYVSLYNGDYVQKIDTRTDKVVGNANVGSTTIGGIGGAWNIINLSPMDTALMVSGWVSNGYVVAVNTSTMAINNAISINKFSGGTNLFPYPHGLAANATFDTFFATLQYGNVINRYTFKGGFHRKMVSVNGAAPVTTNPSDKSSPNPHEIMMLPGGRRYVVTCQSTNELRVLDAHKDTVIATIPMGTEPVEMDIAPSRGLLFVTCMEDAGNTLPGRRGSVYVIDINNLQVVKKWYGDFYQPHDVTVDEQNNQVFVVSRNANPNGPAPHHASACGGRSGWYSVYDLNTLEPANSKRYELTVDPYLGAARFR